MLCYRALRAINGAYPLTVFWIYVGAFILAFMMMFFFPPGSLLLLWVGLVGLVLAVVTARILSWLQQIAGARRLAASRCPMCDQPLRPDDGQASGRRCDGCGITFGPDGAERMPS